MLGHFYDIESVENAFTLANYMPEGPHVDLYYLVDDPALTNDPNFIRNLIERVYLRNPNFHGTVAAFDLHTEPANRRMAIEFGLSNAMYVNNPAAKSTFPAEFRPMCDTDPGFDDEKFPYLMGYNSYNYDTTMLALYFYSVFTFVQNAARPYEAVATVCQFRPTTAKLMRIYNDQLFSKKFKKNMPDRLLVKSERQNYDGTTGWSKPNYSATPYLIRKNMLMSGRHVDVARLNEKAERTGLKRLLGMLGGQILESDKLKPGQNRLEDADQLYELMAYNVSDVVNLKHILFDHPVYTGNFNLKKGLLQTYPELVYDRASSDEYKPVIDPYHVRKDRLFVDSSSAQLATKALCPYDHLVDIPVVDFMYPAKEKAMQKGIPQVDILEQTKQLFEAKFPQPEIRAQFERIYNFYATHVRGHNFNESKNYASDYFGKGTPPAENSQNLPKTNLCIPYYNADGTPSSCFAQFSIGGIHGAEYNIARYEYDMEQYQKRLYRQKEVQRRYPDPLDVKRAKQVEIMDIDGEIRAYPAKDFLTANSTLKSAKYRPLEEPPELFKLKSGAYKLNDDYGWTSADLTNHEDFKSYYPNLLCMMMAFWNKGLGYDRYAEIFDQKESLGKKMKDKTISEKERQTAAVQREGTKLILNSASGAADATFESAIRMNNNIIKMRVIGQLFSFTIGMSQTYYGAKIPSTNTDGLYSVMEATRNNEILAQESANIGVEIEPEPIYLISKDTNNRIELNPDDGGVAGASGGTLSCQVWAGKKGPQPTKNLAHCAITDWALCEYLVFAATSNQERASLTKPFNPEVGMKILLSAHSKMDKVRLLNMFQNVLASSPGSETYIFATTPTHPEQPIPLQHYNRVFIMRDNTPGTVHIYAATVRTLTEVQLKNRAKNDERSQQHDPTALYVLNTNGVETMSIAEGKEAVVKKVTDVDPSWFMYVENRNLSYIPEEDVDKIIENLDYGKYLYLLAKAFDGATMDQYGKKGSSKGWRNKLPNCEPATDIREFITDIDTAATKLGITLPGRAQKPQNVGQTPPATVCIPDDNPAENEPETPVDNTPNDTDPKEPKPTANQVTEPAVQPEPQIVNPAAQPIIPTPQQSVQPVVQPQQEPPVEPIPPAAPPALDPNNIARLLKEKTSSEITQTQTSLRQHLGACVDLVLKLQNIPNSGLPPQYIADLQKHLQMTIEKL